MMAQAPSSGLLARFIAIVGEGNAMGYEEDLTPYTHENQGRVAGKTPLVVKPKTREEVAALLKLANENNVNIVPQGGNTGRVGAATPLEEMHSIVVNMQRMNRIIEFDPAENVLSVEAGAILETVQNFAADNDRLFPLALGAQGSCMIGGNVSTNAGGTGVLAYGNMRDLVMGLEVVLPDGGIWNGMNKLRKDNTGYDLKNLFIGAEGTLGIITAAVLKLFPAPAGRAVTWTGFSSLRNVLNFFYMARKKAGGHLTAFELIPRIGVEFLLRRFRQFRNPLAGVCPWHALVEISSLRSVEKAQALAEEILATGLEDKTLADAALAVNLAQQKTFWRMRENLSLAQRPEGASISHDVSVPVGKIPELIERAGSLIAAIVPKARMVAFGHLGDGNIHLNFSRPLDMTNERYLEFRKQINRAVYDLTLELGGSISAEHGIGLFKRDLLEKTKSPIEMAMMRKIKRALDPKGIMNPDKILGARHN